MGHDPNLGTPSTAPCRFRRTVVPRTCPASSILALAPCFSLNGINANPSEPIPAPLHVILRPCSLDYYYCWLPDLTSGVPTVPHASLNHSTDPRPLLLLAATWCWSGSSNSRPGTQLRSCFFTKRSSFSPFNILYHPCRTFLHDTHQAYKSTLTFSGL